MNAMNRKDGVYKVKLKGEWVFAKWVTNQDIDSSWSCWIIDGIEPPKESWGFVDSDFQEINETIINPLNEIIWKCILEGCQLDSDLLENNDTAVNSIEKLAKKNAIDYSRFRDTYKRHESQKMHIYHQKLGGLTSWIGMSDENIYEAYLKGEQHYNPLIKEMEDLKSQGGSADR